MLPKTWAYIKSYDRQTKWTDCLIENNNLLENYNTLWDKVSADKKEDSWPVSNIFLKTTIHVMVIKLQICMIKKFLRWSLIIRFWQ